MNIKQIYNPAFRGILVATTLALATISGFATADELKFKLTGAMEVPPVTTAATGNADLTINKDMTVKGKIMTSGIAGSMAHIHHGKVGANGPPIVTLSKSGDNGWDVPAGAKLNEAEYKAYLAGDLYVNVHSAEHPGGEIRGQLMPAK